MSKDIKLKRGQVDQSINTLSSSVKSLDANFTQGIEGDSRLDMVDALNGIRGEYDKVLAQFESIFLKNIDSTKKSIEGLQEVDRQRADQIRLM